ncbi:NADPH-dependent oxidoreductase [Alteromonas sediminis]|uniref:NADPH-dependent oxidoreductase n=1 Tax=Alteromonas sediminis TaxID=2259342 RepID=A0A3N5XW91_9ALTE|nr:NAD(P)H-dependent oxidoreductase [Alteromonas sediminis]RPJ65067.1 NADPH-dependent oxidoreductase [Alteromonas sediminis]
MVKVLAFAGSTRKGSFNQAILDIAVQGARSAGADVTVINLADYPMPLFNQDEEADQGIHENAQAFKTLLTAHDGFLIASPEYNSSYPALLKNVIDWASRSAEGEKPMQAFKGKVAAIMASSPGALGGLRVLVPLRMLLENIGTLVLPNQRAIANVHTLMDDNGQISDARTVQQLQGLAVELVETLQKLKSK